MFDNTFRGAIRAARPIRAVRAVIAAIAFVVAGASILIGTAPAHARELGVDVSHHQGATGISQTSWNGMSTDGKQFAWIKATEGLTPPGNVDPAWQNNVVRATTAGVFAGVYHFARPDNRPNVAGAIAEAGHFVSTAGNAMNPGHLRPVIDLERGSAMTTADLTDWVLAFVNEVINLKGPGAAPIVYTSMGYATLELDSRVANLDAWLVDLSAQDPQTGAPFTTGQFNNWTVWQYSHTGASGGISPLDLDVIHSEYKPLSSLVIVPEPTSLAGLAAMTLLCTLRRRFPAREPEPVA